MAAGIQVIYLHGFASSAQNSKGLKLLNKSETTNNISFISFDFNPKASDFSNMTITGMINRLRQFILDREISNCYLVGSSLGGLVALHYTKQYGGIRKMLLLAPALRQILKHDENNNPIDYPDSKPVFHYAFNKELPLFNSFIYDAKQYEGMIEPPVEIEIIHGVQDDVVPIAESRNFAALYPEKVHLIEVNSGHRLEDQIDLIWDQILKFSKFR